MTKSNENNIYNEIIIAESLINKTEKILKENKSKLKDIKPQIEQKLNNLKESIKKNDLDKMRIIMDELWEPVREISTRIYEPPKETTIDDSCDVCQTKIDLSMFDSPSKPKKKEKKEV